MDPLEGDYSATWTADDYWFSSLTHVPMGYLPFFSHCTGGVRIGKEPSDKKNYAADEGTPFRIGHDEGEGGSPVRRRGTKVKCDCFGVLTWEVTTRLLGHHGGLSVP
jgi:hypothetical protein